MHMSFMSILVFILSSSLGQGGGNELIHYIPTEAYWQSKGAAVSLDTMMAEIQRPAEPLPAMDADALKSLEEAARSKDPAIASAARTLLVKQRTGDKPGQVRRLMAIRALGEMKDPRAIEALRPLAESDAPSMADQARRAIARIEGRPLPQTSPAPEVRDQDLWLLPAEMGIVGQITFGGGEEMMLAQMLQQVPPEMAEQAKEVPQMLIRQLLPMIEQTGNARLDTVTFGISQDVGRHGGFVIFIARGQYDRGALSYVVSQQGGKSEMIDGIEVFRPDREVALMFPDNTRAVFIVSEGQDLPVKALIEHMNKGEGQLKQNEAMGRLLAGIDRTQPLWAGVIMGPSYRQVPVVNVFDTLTLVGRREGQSTQLEIRATGSDAAAVQQAVEQLRGHIAEGLAQMERQAPRMPAMKPYLDFMKSIELTQDGTTARLTATFTSPSPAALLLPVFGILTPVRIEGEVAP